MYTEKKRLRIENGQFVSNGSPVGLLKGFNVQVASTISSQSFVWPAQTYIDIANMGCKLVRHPIFWDVFEPTRGTFNPAAIESLDMAIYQAENAGLYSILSLPHLLAGREPKWVNSSGNILTDWLTNGQELTQFIANRYSSNLSVIGCDMNEPPGNGVAIIQQAYTTYVNWWQAESQLWPLWISFCYANATPYPDTGPQVNPLFFKNLDKHNLGVIFSVHDYLNSAGTYGIYQKAGTGNTGNIAPVNQSPNDFTAQFHGWGNYWTYPNTNQTRADFASLLAPYIKLASSYGTFALAVTEFGMDSINDTNWVQDKVAAFNNAKTVAQLWWDYNVQPVSNSSADPFSARPNQTWRPSIQNWLT